MTTRNTIQRNMVLGAVEVLNHPTAEQVFAAVTQQYPNISRGTVYRNLNLLVEKGALRKVFLSDGADCFDTTVEDHYHVRCTICGQVDDVTFPFQDNLLNQVQDNCGYIVTGHDIQFRGICPVCRKRGQS